MRKVLVISALVIALMAPAVPATAATRTKHPAPVTASHEVQVLKLISDHVALLKVPLPLFLKRPLNMVLKAIGPQLCNVVASLADTSFQPIIGPACLQIMQGPDPLGDFAGFLEPVCANDAALGQMVFPKYKDMVPILCGLLL